MNSVSAVIIGHQDVKQVKAMIRQLKRQSQPPDEIILCVCCMDTTGIKVDIILNDRHHDDVGQSKCDMGLRLATKQYVGFFSSDDEYLPDYIEKLASVTAEVVFCDFWSHLIGKVIEARPEPGVITRGCYLVDRQFALQIGYRHRNYIGDGLFIMDLMNLGATAKRVPELLYYHR